MTARAAAKKGFSGRSRRTGDRDPEQQPACRRRRRRRLQARRGAALADTRAPTAAFGVDGVFAPNESSAFAVMRVLKDNGWAGNVKFVGFDASDGCWPAFATARSRRSSSRTRSGWATLSVVTMVKHLRGEKVERRIDTGVHLVTRDALDRPDISSSSSPISRNDRLGPRARDAGSTNDSTRRCPGRRRSVVAPAKCAASSARTAPARAR